MGEMGEEGDKVSVGLRVNESVANKERSSIFMHHSSRELLM